jgi:hypothetical protein
MSNELISKRILESLIMDGKKADSAVANIWASLFDKCSYDAFDEIWTRLSATRFPTKVEILCALAGFDPHEDWLKITQIVSGEIEEHTIYGISAIALKKAGGLGRLRDLSRYDADQFRKNWWFNLDVGGTNAIMPANVAIRIRDNSRSAHDIEGHYPIDATGEVRARALMNCIDKGTAKPRIAAGLAQSLPSFWRNLVYQTCEQAELGSSKLADKRAASLLGEIGK